MKNSYLVIAFMLVSGICSAQGKAIKTGIDVKRISSTKWNSIDGIAYTQVPGANLGASSFEVLGNNRIAFLCNSTSEIVVINSISGKVIQRFPVSFAPRDFSYDGGHYYVLTEYNVDVFDETGKKINNFPFSNTIHGVERICRYNKGTYLLLPSGTSCMIESDDKAYEPKELSGWINASGDRIETKITGINTYTVTIYSLSGNKITSVFQTDAKIAGVFVVGSSTNRIILDVQTYISENPIQVTRKIVSVDLSNSTDNKIVAEIIIPNVYYVLSNKDFSFSPKGQLYNMITAPTGVFIYLLREMRSDRGIIHHYPDFLTKKSYHFNDNLLPIEAK